MRDIYWRLSLKGYDFFLSGTKDIDTDFRNLSAQRRRRSTSKRLLLRPIEAETRVHPISRSEVAIENKW